MQYHKPDIKLPVLFMCHTSAVRSADGQEHLILCSDLPRLYGIPIQMCKMVHSMNDIRGYTPEYLDSMVHLFARSSGDYSHVPKPGIIEKEQ